MSKRAQTQGELTDDPEDKHPFRKKQQRAIGSGKEAKKKDKTLKLFQPVKEAQSEEAQKCGKRLSWKRRFG